MKGKTKIYEFPAQNLNSDYLVLSSKYSDLSQDNPKALQFNFGKNGLAASGGYLKLLQQSELIDEVCWGTVKCDNHYDAFITKAKTNKTLVRKGAHIELFDEGVDENNPVQFIFKTYLPDITANIAQLENLATTKEASEASTDDTDAPVSNKNTETSDSVNNNTVSTKNSTNKNKSQTKAITKKKNCPAGKYLNPLTNRCKKIAKQTVKSSTVKDAAAIKPKTCPAGKYLNPLTNRCKKIPNSQPESNSPKPCKVGYERNPETNRCRKIASTTSTKLKPCKEGYERNPETNRCRKKKSTNTGTEYSIDHQAKEASEKSKPVNIAAFSTFGAAAIAATTYTGYQFRHKIKKFILEKIIGHHKE